jgi:PAS domain-containing protein
LSNCVIAAWNASDRQPLRERGDTFFSDTYIKTAARRMQGCGAMPINRPKSKTRTRKSAHTGGRSPVRRPKAVPKLINRGHRISEVSEIERSRAEADAAIAAAARSNALLREAIDILPQGIVFLDAEGRYILWNKKYAEIYNKSADLFEEGAMLRDTLKVGVARGDYPEAVGREDEWINPNGSISSTIRAIATSRFCPMAGAS